MEPKKRYGVTVWLDEKLRQFVIKRSDEQNRNISNYITTLIKKDRGKGE